MTRVEIAPGEWVVAFGEGYFLPGDDIRDWLERFTTWGGGWDGHRATDIYRVLQVVKAMPKTYLALERRRRAPAGMEEVRASRFTVIASFRSEQEAVKFRDDFHAIGVKTTKRIEAEAARRVAAFAERETAKALKQVHKALPHIFGVKP